MATYVNDLRLKEIATGDEAGTWGTSTNTNLELIAEAFSFGTEAITTNADTHTTTIADGSTDPGRSIFLKYTGTLDSACTITIGPNTVSKLWFIENATSGSQNIIIKQGSGATITVPNGQVKAIYSDGAGSGGAMVDAFQDLSVPDLFVDDDLTVGDDLTFTSDSAVITFGADGDTTLTHTDGSGLTLNSTNKIMFNDASQFIQGSSATVLALGATDEIDLTATAIDVNGTMDVSGALTGTTATLTTADNSTQLTLKSTDDDANAGPVFDLVRDSASPADSDVLGRIRFRADNDAGEETTMVYLQTYLHDASDGSEDGGLDLFARLAGSLTRRITINSSGEICFNEDSNDIDFRVESDGNANMLFVDAGNNSVGIGESNPNSYGTLAVTGTGAIGNFNASSGAATIQLYENGAGRFGITTPNGSAGANFTLAGSTHLTIDSNGSLGIGTTSPQTSTSGLHVVHDNTEGTPSFPLGEVIIAQRNFNSAQGCHIGIIGGSAGDAAINFGDKDDADIGRITYSNANNSMGFVVNTSEAMLVNSDGYVNAKGNVAGDNAPDTQGLHFGWNYSNGAGESLIVFNRGAGTTGGLTFVDNSSSGTHDEVMRLENGNLGLGTTAPSRLLHLKADDSCLLQLQVGNTTGNCQVLFGDSGTTTAGKILYNHTGNVMSFETNSSEAMRIDGSGRLLHGVTSGNAFFHEENPSNQTGHQITTINNYTKPHIQVASVTAASTSFFHFVGQTGDGSSVTSNAIIIYGNGNIVNVNNSYGSLSDVKLKENIVDSGSQWEDIKAVRVRKYSMIADKQSAPNRIGVIAQELESAGMGGLVIETSDRDENFEELETSTKTVQYSVLYMKAIKALQEAMTRIETLEAKVQTLEEK